MHILIVEDEKVLCDTIVRSLKHLSYSVDYCHDGQTAIDMLAVDHFDLVVLDLNLPRKDGMSVLKALRENDFDTKVLILSARSEVADKVAGLDAGANDYLTKPFHLETIKLFLPIMPFFIILFIIHIYRPLFLQAGEQESPFPHSTNKIISFIHQKTLYKHYFHIFFHLISFLIGHRESIAFSDAISFQFYTL